MNGKQFHTLTLGGDDPLAIRAWLDGIPLKGIRRLEISSGVGDPTTVTLELIVEIGDVPTKLAHR